jgi:hypothetical protein
MRYGAISLILAAAATMFTACASNRGPSPELTAALDSRSDCETRFRSAEKISSVQDRDLAFSQIALGAVDCRNDEVLRNSIDRISAPTLRDDTAYRCAVALAKAGRGLMAATIANAIVNSNIRATALLAINQTTPEQKDESLHSGE